MESPSASGPRAQCRGAHPIYLARAQAGRLSLNRSCRTARSVVFPTVALTIARAFAPALSDGHAEAFEKSRVVSRSCPTACPVRRVEPVWTSAHSLHILAASSLGIAPRAAPPSYSGLASRVELSRVSCGQQPIPV
jgi:hypothetical protein